MEIDRLETYLIDLHTTVGKILSEIEDVKKDIAILRLQSLDKSLDESDVEIVNDATLREFTREEFTSRTYNLLIRSGLRTYKDIILVGRKRLHNTRGFGIGSIEEIAHKLKEDFGIDFQDAGMNVQHIKVNDFVVEATTGKLYMVRQVNDSYSGLHWYVCDKMCDDYVTGINFTASQVIKKNIL